MIDDTLERPSAEPAPAPDFLRSFREPMADLNGKSILVTGGTGSFGRAFCRAVAREFTPRKLIVFSRDELKQYEMAQDFPADRHPYMRFFIGDVRDAARLELAMRDVDYVIHAAALKHVTVAEYNPFECVQTNILGAQNIATAAIRTGVKRVVALSTDKAANPVNLYGASKLVSDKIFIAATAMSGMDGCRFSVVRYGNVLGSRGSVIPFFRKLQQEGASVLPITDPRMTRFWITVEQGVSFVLSSLEMMEGGEVFVPKIPSMNTVEIAKVVAPGLEHEVIGLRPGERLHEVMVPEDEWRTGVELEDRYVLLSATNDKLRRDYVDRGAAPLPEGFCYASNRNEEQLGADDLRTLLSSTMR